MTLYFRHIILAFSEWGYHSGVDKYVIILTYDAISSGNVTDVSEKCAASVFKVRQCKLCKVFTGCDLSCRGAWCECCVTVHYHKLYFKKYSLHVLSGLWLLIHHLMPRELG